MAWMVIFTQVLLPLILLAWVAFHPAAGGLAWWLQWVSVAAILLGIGLAALWTMPPFWVPYAYGLLLALITVTHLVRKGRPGPGLWRESSFNTVAILLAAGLGLVGAHMAWQALEGQILPQETVVDIAPPFPPGHYLIAHGGSTPMVNIHLKTLNRAVDHFRPWRGQSKALDIFRISPLGWHKKGWQPTEPDRYATFGVPVIAPCQGKVALVIDGIDDMPVAQMDRDHLAGNYVAIDCGDFFLILAHLRQDSIAVVAGDKVNTGDSVAQMGNSGNSSEPHLHIHAQRGLPEQTPLAGDPIWLTINNRFLVRNNRLRVF